MTNYSRIVHPTDFSGSADAAFGCALELARRQGSELHLLHVAPTFGEDPLHSAYTAALDERQFYKQLQEEADVRMRAMIDAHEADDVRVKRVHTHGASPAPVVIRYARDEGADLIVVGTHGRRGLRRFLLGSVAEEVMRGAGCDVLAVREGASPGFKRLLVPLDLTEGNRQQLDKAAEFARIYDARLDALYVLPEPPLPAWGVDADVLYELLPDRKKQAAGELAALIAPVAETGLSIEAHLEEGFAARVIHESAERVGADLIVIAPHSRSAVERFFLGSITEWVIRHSPTPVLITHSTVLRSEEKPPSDGKSASSATT